MTAGVDILPLDTLRQRGIIITSGRGIHKIFMAEYAIAAMINLARNSHFMFRNQMGVWSENSAAFQHCWVGVKKRVRWPICLTYRAASPRLVSIQK